MIFKHFEPKHVSAHAILLLVPPTLATVCVAQHMHAFLAIASSFALFYIVLLSSIIIYRISPIHPLSQYPGPLLLKISKLSLAWVSTTGKQHIYVSDLHDKYGDAIRIGMFKNVISVERCCL